MVRIIFDTFNHVIDRVMLFYLQNPRVLLIVLVLTVFLFHYLHNVVQKPLLFSANGQFGWFLRANCPSISEKYWPTIWCYPTHLHTPLATVLRGLLPPLKYHREYIATPDGGQISIDWYDPDGDGEQCNFRSTPTNTGVIHRCNSAIHSAHNAPIALFIPGITGCSQAEYLKTFVPIAYRAGYRPVAINYRGMGNTALLTPRLYCGADDEDLRTALAHIRATNPAAKIVGTGISLGGVILARYLIATGAQAQIDAAFLVSVVWNYLEALPNIEKGFNYPLNRFLTRSLIGIVEQHRETFRDLPQYDLDAVQRCRTMQEFDNAFTIRMFNFESTTDYYAACVHSGKVAAIQKPTLCINAVDDMFAPGESLPVSEFEANEYIAMLVTSRGGHIGFMDGFLPNLTRSYMERLLEDYLVALIELPDFRRDLSPLLAVNDTRSFAQKQHQQQRHPHLHRSSLQAISAL